MHAQFGVHPDELAARIEADADDLAARSARLFATFLEITHRSAG
ncbi:hypothetical protein [Williamsia sp. CHRR-6]|nr:hypothetical protein [Williamsia sp. CHRR-6]